MFVVVNFDALAQASDIKYSAKQQRLQSVVAARKNITYAEICEIFAIALCVMNNGDPSPSMWALFLIS